ncbi:hypothetical protein ACWDTI_22600 [Gordonia sp. NPDC003424]
MSDSLRTQADVWGKAIGGLGTAAVGWVGLTKATDVFPLVGVKGWCAFIAAAVFLAAMAFSAFYVGYLLQVATRQIYMLLNIQEMIFNGDISAPTAADNERENDDDERRRRKSWLGDARAAENAAIVAARAAHASESTAAQRNHALSAARAALDIAAAMPTTPRHRLRRLIDWASAGLRQITRRSPAQTSSTAVVRLRVAALTATAAVGARRAAIMTTQADERSGNTGVVAAVEDAAAYASSVVTAAAEAAGLGSQDLSSSTETLNGRAETADTHVKSVRKLTRRLVRGQEIGDSVTVASRAMADASRATVDAMIALADTLAPAEIDHAVVDDATRRRSWAEWRAENKKNRRYQRRRSEASIIADAYYQFGHLNVNAVVIEENPLPADITTIDKDEQPDELADQLAYVDENGQRYDWIDKAAKSITKYSNIGVEMEMLAERNPHHRLVPQWLARSAQIRAEVYATQTRAMAIVVRRRVVSMVTGPRAAAAIIVFAIALIGVSFTADWAVSLRTAESTHLDTLTKCASAVDAMAKARLPIVDGNESRLPAACGNVSAGTVAHDTTVNDVIAANLGMLAARLSECEAAVGTLDRKTCDRLVDAINAQTAIMQK